MREAENRPRISKISSKDNRNRSAIAQTVDKNGYGWTDTALSGQRGRHFSVTVDKYSNGARAGQDNACCVERATCVVDVGQSEAGGNSNIVEKSVLVLVGGTLLRSVWLSSWLNALYTMMFSSSGQISQDSGTVSDVINNLKKIPFIPLSDGTYSSVDDGTIWLHSDGLNPRFDDHGPEAFPVLYAKLRTVSPALLCAAATVDNSCLGESIMGNLIRMLQRIGVQRVSAHEIVKVHIFPAISYDKITIGNKTLMIEYLSFIMSHLQSSCPTCHTGVFLSPSEVYWHDLTGSMNQIKDILPHSGSSVIDRPLCKTLCNIYPSLHVFFVNECGVNEIPHLRSYLQILLQLSTAALPSQGANMVFQVFLLWSDGLKSGLLSPEDVAYLKDCLLKLEFTVLPTVLDKWVSLHPSFGLVCWCDDEKLRKEFRHLNNIDFLYFGELSDDEQEMLRVKVTVLMQNLGIPALSEIVTREAIYYGMADCSFKTSLLNWALPYAQRYIYNVHHDRYVQLKQFGFENLSRLQIVVVENLFYRNIIRKSNIASKKRFECSCLLQGNVLYATWESDSHALFMELSCLIFNGTPNLHLANFLHMITTMAESGSNEEQTEFFILNSQKVPKLPDEESVWSISSGPSSTENDETIWTSASTITNEQDLLKSKKKPRIDSSWPPVDWKTAPGFSFARASGLRTQAAIPPPSSSSMQVMANDSQEKIARTDRVVPIETNANWMIEADPVATATVVLPDSEASDRSNLVASGVDVEYDSVDLINPHVPNLGSDKSSERDQLPFGTPSTQQSLLTGRMGELVAFNYFATNFGKTNVTWVNEDTETGLPYDIVVGDNQKSKEYIEVKATKYAKKNWFTISAREWQCAVEKGEFFSIAHVVLSGNNMARITVYKNPVKLCQLGKMQLAVVVPKQQQEFSTAS